MQPPGRNVPEGNRRILPLAQVATHEGVDQPQRLLGLQAQKYGSENLLDGAFALPLAHAPLDLPSLAHGIQYPDNRIDVGPRRSDVVRLDVVADLRHLVNQLMDESILERGKISHVGRWVLKVPSYNVGGDARGAEADLLHRCEEVVLPPRTFANDVALSEIGSPREQVPQRGRQHCHQQIQDVTLPSVGGVVVVDARGGRRRPSVAKIDQREFVV